MKDIKLGVALFVAVLLILGIGISLGFLMYKFIIFPLVGIEATDKQLLLMIGINLALTLPFQIASRALKK